VKSSQLAIRSGHTQPRKQVLITGLPAEQLARKLSALP